MTGAASAAATPETEWERVERIRRERSLTPADELVAENGEVQARATARRSGEPDERLQRWLGELEEVGECEPPFPLTVQPAAELHDDPLSVSDAQCPCRHPALEVQGVTAGMKVCELKTLVAQSLANDSSVSLFMVVDEQHLSIAGTGTALEEDAHPVGAYGVKRGVTLNLARQDAHRAKVRRARRERIQRARLARGSGRSRQSAELVQPGLLATAGAVGAMVGGAAATALQGMPSPEMARDDAAKSESGSSWEWAWAANPARQAAQVSSAACAFLRCEGDDYGGNDASSCSSKSCGDGWFGCGGDGDDDDGPWQNACGSCGGSSYGGGYGSSQGGCGCGCGGSGGGGSAGGCSGGGFGEW